MILLGTGLNGLIGSRIVELLVPTYQFEPISRSTGIDITNKEQVQAAIKTSQADVVIHLAAYTNVKEAELEKNKGEQSEAWKSNVLGTEYIAQACKESGKKLIYFSTDLVFDGEDAPKGGYTEEDTPHPLNWYARTKYEGELRLREAASDWVILRVAYPYRAVFSKLDFVRLFKDKLGKGEPLTVLEDRIITPVFIDDIATAIKMVIEKNSQGIYHTVGNSSVSIAEVAYEIADVFGYNKNLITTISRREFLIGRPPEPFNSSLSNGKISQLGIKMSTLREGLEKVKEQISHQA